MGRWGCNPYAIRLLDTARGYTGFVHNSNIEPRYKVGDKVRLVKHSKSSSSRKRVHTTLKRSCFTVRNVMSRLGCH